MRAVGLVPKRSGLELLDVPEPTLRSSEDVLLRVLEVGVCGTDREIARGDLGEAPPNHQHLIIGHEMLAEVAEIGSEGGNLREGDLVVATVRRGCGQCPACRVGAVDFCSTGQYVEHGIKQLNGFMAEKVVTQASNVVTLPTDLRDIGVLLEPTTVVEKALEQARLAFARLPAPPIDRRRGTNDPRWAEGLRALVAGSGPIGMLGAMILRAHGAEVTVIDRSDDDTLSSKLIKQIGARHVNSSGLEMPTLAEKVGPIDLIVEATGAAAFSFRLIEVLGPNGVYVMTGIPALGKDEPLPAGALMRTIVLNNQVILGTVNASHENFAQGVEDLALFRSLWGDTINQVITARVPMEQFMEAIEPKQRGIKSVVKIR